MSLACSGPIEAPGGPHTPAGSTLQSAALNSHVPPRTRTAPGARTPARRARAVGRQVENAAATGLGNACCQRGSHWEEVVECVTSSSDVVLALDDVHLVKPLEERRSAAFEGQVPAE